MDFSAPQPVLVTCFKGLAPFLEEEVRALGLRVRDRHETGVELDATWRDCLRLNLWLRTALNVQIRLADVVCAGPEDLYAALRRLPWEEWVSPETYLTVVSRVDTPSIDNSMYASLKAKDAIVDRIQARLGARPDSGPERGGLVLHLYWKGDRARFYLNTSGRKLADRGYRKRPGRAPLREPLAAGIVMAAGYDGSRPLLLPMGGSGTLAVEAVLLAQHRAPGLLRDHFGFQHWRGYDEAEWQALRREARAAAEKRALAPILLTDRDPEAVRAAQHNARTAGVEHLLETRVCDIAETPVPPEPGTVIINPPYGERLGRVKALEAEYARFGDWLKQSCPGYTAWVLTGSKRLAGKVGLRSSRRIPLWNGKLECRLLKYELYRGSRAD
jgi:putative N6-adenine-specific DNA methylase